MIERTTGIVLRTHPLTETSLIVNWLTPDFGRLGTVAKGARRPKSPFRGKLDLFYLADFTFVRSRRSQLHILHEVGVRDIHEPLRHELAWVEQAAYCARLLEQTTETESPLPHLFQLMAGLLDHLPAHPPEPQTVFAFELKLLNELGLKPDFAKTRLSAGTEQLLQKLTELDWPALSRLKLAPAQSTEIRQFLHGFLIYHLGKIPAGRSRAILG